MSKIKASELRNQSWQELEQKKDGLEKELHDLRQKKITGQLDKPHFFKLHRRQIARIKTIQNEMGPEAAKAAPKAEKAEAKAPAQTKQKAGKK